MITNSAVCTLAKAIAEAMSAPNRNEGTTDKTEFFEAKLAVARFYMARILPQHTALAAAMESGKAPIMGLAEAAY